MTSKEPWIEKIVKEAKKIYGPVEVKFINGHYYLYKVSSVYDKTKGRARKISGDYIGAITPNGLEETRRRPRSVFEYANGKLLYSLLEEILPNLKKYFPDSWKELVALAIVRTIRNTPIKYAKDAWEKLYVSEEIDASMSPNTIIDRLRSVGSDWYSVSEFYRALMVKGEYYLFDLSSIFSRSVNINIAEKGYNKEALYVNQINFSMIYSRGKRIPVMLKAIHGSIRDVKELKEILHEFPMEDCILIMERGFYSIEELNKMAEEGVYFIQPMRRNSIHIDYGAKYEGSFVYRERGIRYGRKKVEGYTEYIYEDALLKGEELSNIIKKGIEGKENEIEENRLGKITIITNLDLKGEEIYNMYKMREDIEQAFDAMKNELENDKSYLQDDDAVRGYFFVSYISLYLYYAVQNRIREVGMNSKISVNELLLYLSKVYAIKYGDGRIMYGEIPKKVE
ncbi:MAG: transposase, partial [bacterium]